MQIRYWVAAEKFVRVERALLAALETRNSRTEIVIEKSIESLQEIAQTFHDSNPHIAAGVDSALGQAYLGRIRGERRLNIENAIRHLERAIGVLESLGEGFAWAAACHILGRAYAERSPPEYGKAAFQFERALRVFSKDRFPKEHQAVSGHLAIARQGGASKKSRRIDVILDADIAFLIDKIIDPGPELIQQLSGRPAMLKLIESAQGGIGRIVIVDRTRRGNIELFRATLRLFALIFITICISILIDWNG